MVCRSAVRRRIYGMLRSVTRSSPSSAAPGRWACRDTYCGAAHSGSSFVAGGTLFTACSTDPRSMPDTSALAASTASPRRPRVGNAGAAQRRPHGLILATTTSTQDSGLLDVLVPLFEQQRGYRVKTIAVGSGRRLHSVSAGEADVVLAHAPEDELAFVESGAGVNRQLVMYNDFILVGPPGDPAGLPGKRTDRSPSGAGQLGRTVCQPRRQLRHPPSSSRASGGRGRQAAGPTLVHRVGQRHGPDAADRRPAWGLHAQRPRDVSGVPDRIDAGIALEGDPRLRNLYHVIAVNGEQHPQVKRPRPRR